MAGRRRTGSHVAQSAALDWSGAGPVLDPAAGAAIAVGVAAVALVELAAGAVVAAVAAAGPLGLARKMAHSPQSPQPLDQGSSASSGPVVDP